MDLSDDIAYSVHDFEDAIVNGYLDVPALSARVNHDELVDSMFVWIGGAIDHDSLIAAFDRLDNLDAWIDSWDSSRRDLARLKNLTSQLIGRFAGEAVRATRRGASGGHARAVRGRRRHPRRDARRDRGAQGHRRRERHVDERAQADLRAAARDADRARRPAVGDRSGATSTSASPPTGPRHPTTPPAAASSSTRSPRSPTSRPPPGTSAWSADRRPVSISSTMPITTSQIDQRM